MIVTNKGLSLDWSDPDEVGIGQMCHEEEISLTAARGALK